MNVGDRVFFETDQTDLTPTAVATLDKQAQWLSRYPRYTFLIEGHADERGTREYNFSLGAAARRPCATISPRAAIQASRIRTVSYGKERPVAVCNDISCWSQNRRAVTVLDGGAGVVRSLAMVICLALGALRGGDWSVQRRRDVAVAALLCYRHLASRSLHGIHDDFVA